MYTTANNRLTQLTQILLPIVNDADSSFAQYLLQNPTFAPNPESSLNPEKPFKIAVVGSGNWGTTIAKIVAENALARPHLFSHYVNMWVFEEKINGENLTQIINQRHENIKFYQGLNYLII